MKLIVLTLLALVSKTQALSCYQCSQTGNLGSCPLDGSGLSGSECPSVGVEAKVCVAASITGSPAGDIISRSCAPACTAGKATLAGVTTETKCCSTDNCNGDFASIPAGGGGGDNPTEAPNPPEEKFQCYNCGSKTCTESQVEDCDDGDVCITTTVSVPLLGTGYTRGCIAKAACTETNIGGFGTKCCDTSLCNAGATVKVSIVAMLVAVLVALWARN